MVQWLRLHGPNAGGPGSIPGQGTRAHMPTTRKIQHTAAKGLHAASKTEYPLIFSTAK